MKWIDRTFDFSGTESRVPELIERLRGTPVRVEARVKDVSAEILTRRDGERWSIQENVGHLVKVEGLFLGRLDDFDSGAETLRAAEEVLALPIFPELTAQQQQRVVDRMGAFLRRSRGGHPLPEPKFLKHPAARKKTTEGAS